MGNRGTQLVSKPVAQMMTSTTFDVSRLLNTQDIPLTFVFYSSVIYEASFGNSLHLFGADLDIVPRQGFEESVTWLSAH